MTKKTKPKIEESPVKTLTTSELNRLELNHEQEKLRRATVEIASLKLEAKLLERRANEYVQQVKDFEAREIVRGIDKIKENNETARDAHKEFIAELKSKYNLDDGFGFDPETGELKE